MQLLVYSFMYHLATIADEYFFLFSIILYCIVSLTDIGVVTRTCYSNKLKLISVVGPK